MHLGIVTFFRAISMATESKAEVSTASPKLNNRQLIMAVSLLVFILLNVVLFDTPLHFLRHKPQGQQTFLDLLNVDLLSVVKLSTIYQMTLYQI